MEFLGGDVWQFRSLNPSRGLKNAKARIRLFSSPAPETNFSVMCSRL